MDAQPPDELQSKNDSTAPEPSPQCSQSSALETTSPDADATPPAQENDVPAEPAQNATISAPKVPTSAAPGSHPGKKKRNASQVSNSDSDNNTDEPTPKKAKAEGPPKHDWKSATDNGSRMCNGPSADDKPEHSREQNAFFKCVRCGDVNLMFEWMCAACKELLEDAYVRGGKYPDGYECVREVEGGGGVDGLERGELEERGGKSLGVGGDESEGNEGEGFEFEGEEPGFGRPNVVGPAIEEEDSEQKGTEEEAFGEVASKKTN